MILSVLVSLRKWRAEYLFRGELKRISGKVSPYAYLRGGVEFVSELPRTTTGKVSRKALQDMWKKAHDDKS